MLKDFPCGEQSCPAFLSVQTFLTSIFTPQDPRKKQQTYLCPLGPCAPCSCWSMHDETSGLATLRFGLWTKVLHPGSVMSTSALKKTGPKAINISSFTTFQKYIYMHIYIYMFLFVTCLTDFHCNLMRSFLTVSSIKTMKYWTCLSVEIRIHFATHLGNKTSFSLLHTSHLLLPWVRVKQALATGKSKVKKVSR